MIGLIMAMHTEPSAWWVSVSSNESQTSLLHLQIMISDMELNDKELQLWTTGELISTVGSVEGMSLAFGVLPSSILLLPPQVTVFPLMLGATILSHHLQHDGTLMTGPRDPALHYPRCENEVQRDAHSLGSNTCTKTGWGAVSSCRWTLAPVSKCPRGTFVHTLHPFPFSFFVLPSSPPPALLARSFLLDT